MSRILYIGNKNASSWSLRAWLALREKGVAFEEKLIDLTLPGHAEVLEKLSPPGRVPVLLDGETLIYDSLAIMEHANEAFEGPALLPREPAARARARSLLSWMHTGLGYVRAGMPFEGTFHEARLPPPDRARAEASRVARTWEQELTHSGGPHLFGALSLADLTFVPVLRRLKAYGFALDRYPRTAAWAERLMSRPTVKEWMDAAEKLPPLPIV